MDPHDADTAFSISVLDQRHARPPVRVGDQGTPVAGQYIEQCSLRATFVPPVTTPPGRNGFQRRLARGLYLTIIMPQYFIT
jgi:hypothetical protein